MSTGAIRIYNWPPNISSSQMHPHQGHSGGATPIAAGNAAIADSPAHKNQVAAGTPGGMKLVF